MSSEHELRRPFIFVVDDEHLIADTLALILNKNGFEAMPLYSGEKLIEAVEVLKPDALITDVVMGGMSGVEAAIRIREAIPECHILLFSGQAATADLLADARANGHFFEILHKPVHPEAILHRLNKLLPLDRSRAPLSPVVP
jgi:DNA-binding response OmpR family regulator